MSRAAPTAARPRRWINSTAKGKAGERELAAKLRELGFAGARRGQQHAGGPQSPDIADAIPGVHVECKRVETLNVHSAMAQSRADAGPGEVPVVMHRRSRGEWLVTLPLDQLERFCVEALRAMEGGG